MTRTARYLLLASFALALGFCAPRSAKAQAPTVSLQAQLALAAPALNVKVLDLALAAHDKAEAEGLLSNPDILTVIDYSKPSVAPRFWVFDLASQKLLFEELVAHGRNSGDNMATRFSNTESSLASSLGLYVTSEVYMGKHGRSLRLNGLDAGWNDNALARGIVVHAANYVTQAFATNEGRLGRSWGCPALNPKVASRVIDVIKGGTAMFAYYPDSTWLTSSQFLEQPADSDTVVEDAAFALAGEGIAPVGFRARLAAWTNALFDWAEAFSGRIAPLA